MRRRLAILALLSFGSTAVAAPTGNLAKARAEFERGEYQRVVTTLTPEVAQLRDESDLKQAHYLLGVAHYYTKNRDLARQEFSALLYLDPAYDLDAATESPEVYAFYDGLKRELREKLEAIARQKQREEEARRLPSREVLIERTVHETSAWGNFVPFGYGQFRNGQGAKGWFFLVSEVLLGGTSATLFSYQAVQFGIPSHYPADYTAAQRDTFRTRQYIQVGAGALFLVTYVWGVIDAFTNQKPAITTRRTERPLTPERATPGASSSLIPLVSPVVSSDGVGLGATWRF